LSTTEYQVTGMTCGHCEQAVSAEVGRIPSVQSVDVSAASGRLVVTSAVPVRDEEIVAAVDEAGYQAVRTP
jgi:copper chaperone